MTIAEELGRTRTKLCLVAIAMQAMDATDRAAVEQYIDQWRELRSSGAICTGRHRPGLPSAPELALVLTEHGHPMHRISTHRHLAQVCCCG